MKRLLLLLALSVVGCVHRDDVHTTTVYDDSPPPPPPAERETIVTEPPLERPPESPAARPRLSKTITLGEGTDSQYQYAGEPPRSSAPAQGQQGTNVVINNNVVVNNGYGGGYGYGGYVSRGGYGRATTFYNNDARGFRGPSTWGSSGWEGARRTAAPGQTPGVGGNWAPVPSYGPAQMK